MRWWKSKSVRQKLVIAAVVLAVAVAGGAVAAQRFAGDEPAQRTTGLDRKKPDTPKFSGRPLELGTEARISANYRVAVTELTLYNISTARLMVVTVKATYTGKEDGEPWGDLTVRYIGPDTRTVGETGCPFDLGDLDASDQATLKADEETTYGVCINLPAGKLEGGRVSVEEALVARQEGSTSWTTDGAVTKTAPSTAPDSSGSSGDRDSDTSFREPSGDSAQVDNSEVCEKYEDDVEKYKDGIDDLDKWAEQYEDAPGHDEDKVEDYEEWKDMMDKNVRWFDENC